MEGLTDSTTVTYSKLPVYHQSHTGNSNSSITAYSHVGFTPVGYTTATVSVPQLRSTHLEQNSADEREPHLSDCSITPSPSGSSSSRSPNNLERLNIDGIHGSHHTSAVDIHVVPPTPSDSATSSDRDSPSEDRLPGVLLVRIPRKAPVTVPAEPHKNCNGASATSSSPPPPTSPIPAHGITVNLQDRELWQMFNSIGNEMIVTKPGR